MEQPNEYTLRSWARLRDWVDTQRKLHGWSAGEFLAAYELRITNQKLHWLLGAEVPSNRRGTVGRQFRDELTQRRDKFSLLYPKVLLTVFPLSLEQRLAEQYITNELRYSNLLGFELSNDENLFVLYTAGGWDGPPACSRWNERTTRERFPQLPAHCTVIVH